MAREKRSTGKEIGMEDLGCLAIWELEDHDEIPKGTRGLLEPIRHPGDIYTHYFASVDTLGRPVARTVHFCKLEWVTPIPRETGPADAAIDTLIHAALLTQRDWNEEPSMQYSEQPVETLYAALKRGITKLEEHACNAES